MFRTATMSTALPDILYDGGTGGGTTGGGATASSRLLPPPPPLTTVKSRKLLLLAALSDTVLLELTPCSELAAPALAPFTSRLLPPALIASITLSLPLLKLLLELSDGNSSYESLADGISFGLSRLSPTGASGNSSKLSGEDGATRATCVSTATTSLATSTAAWSAGPTATGGSSALLATRGSSDKDPNRSYAPGGVSGGFSGGGTARALETAAVSMDRVGRGLRECEKRQEAREPCLPSRSAQDSGGVMMARSGYHAGVRQGYVRNPSKNTLVGSRFV